MITALDTDVLVNWAIAGASHHAVCRAWLDRELAEAGGRIAVTPQVLLEFLHVATDPRRFEKPLNMRQAAELAGRLWDGRETVQVLPRPDMVHRALALLAILGLGRKRILDTALAATLEAAGIRRFATLNRRDFEVFPFLELVEPG